MKTSKFGVISAVGTYLLLSAIAIHSDVLIPTVKEFIWFISGGVEMVKATNSSFLVMFPVIAAVVVLELPCTMLSAFLPGMVIGKRTGEHGISDMLESMREGSHFFTFFLVVILEELFARWLFLGLLTKLPGLNTEFGFYLLLLVGNALWALIHVCNYKEEKDHHVLRVLPQFVAGIFYGYIYVKYGLLAVILTHFASNAVVFALHKVQQVDGVDALVFIYTGVCALVSYMLMDKPIADIQQWFAHVPTFVIKGWTMGDYIKCSIFLSSSISLVLALLLYDQTVKSKTNEKTETTGGVISYVIEFAIFLWIVYALYGLLGLVISSVPYRILTLAILFAFFQQSESGSSMARTFWASLPIVFVAMCILQALSFWQAMGFLLIESVVHVPLKVLRDMDT